MNITVKSGQIQDQAVDLIVVNHFEGMRAPVGATGAVDSRLAGAIDEIISAGDFKGKLNDTLLLYARRQLNARRVLLLGLGPAAEFTLERARQVAATAARKARELGVKRMATVVNGASTAGLDVQAAAQSLAEGFYLGLYQFSPHKSKLEPDAGRQIDEVIVVEIDAQKVPAIEAGVKAGRAIAEAVTAARDLVNHPSNFMTPTDLAEHARKIVEGRPLSLQVLEADDMRALGMGSLLGVAQGSDTPPKFVVLEYKPAEAADKPPLVFVGKGITFDTGGISIKPAEHMEEMKGDMAGAAAVFGALQAIADLGLPQYVIGITPLVENMPSGKAYKPGDVLKASNGKTIEVISTDAEGRLVLADALVYAGRYKPAAVVDLATLTGACVIALGEDVAAGMFGTDEALKQKLMAASESSAERLWPMPLFDDYKERIKSDTADMKNSGGRYGGVGTSAIFLREFAEGYPWAHLDVAPMTLSERDRPYMPKGATGFGVRLLVQLARDWAA